MHHINTKFTTKVQDRCWDDDKLCLHIDTKCVLILVCRGRYRYCQGRGVKCILILVCRGRYRYCQGRGYIFLMFFSNFISLSSQWWFTFFKFLLLYRCLWSVLTVTACSDMFSSLLKRGSMARAAHPCIQVCYRSYVLQKHIKIPYDI